MSGPPRSVQRVRLRQVCDGRVRFAVPTVARPADVYEAVRRYYKGADREMLSVLCLDAQNQPTCFHVASIGSLNTTRTRPAEILKVALLSNAAGIVLVHNHPSQRADPSPEDIEFTHGVRAACELLGIDLYDHLIVTDSAFCSFRERGLL